MEEYIVSARKYRPMTFKTVIGQDALTTTLKNTVKSGKLAHAYLFCGPRGVGKTTCARIFAKAINCEHPDADGEACNQCESCRAFNEGRSYNIFELDAASNNSIDNIKNLIEQTRIPPQVGKYKVFIIDEVHMLSPSAFNAFLKTLEEPPAYVIFILATTEKHKILPTILSRCQIYDFERMTVPDTIRHLKEVAAKENISYEEEALTLIAEKADGGMRDALSIFDQAASFCQGNITYQKVLEDLNELDSDYYFKMIDLALTHRVSDLMVLLNSILVKGFDGGNLINGLAEHVRNVMMARDESTLPLLDASKEQKNRYRQQARKCTPAFLYRALKIMNNCDIQYRHSSNKRLRVELTLIEIAQIGQDDTDADPGAGPKSHRLKPIFQSSSTAPQNKVTPVPQQKETRKTESTAPSTPPKPTTAPKKPPVAGVTVPQTATTYPAKPRPGGIGMSFRSLLHAGNGTAENERSTTHTMQVPASGEDQPFNQEQLQVQWRGICNDLSTDPDTTGLAQRMKNVSPRITTYPNVELVVDNEILLADIQRIKERVTTLLEQRLHCRSLPITLRLATPDEVGKILTKRELFDEIRTENPGIEKLRDLLDLELT